MDMSFSLLNEATPHDFLNFTLLKGAFSLCQYIEWNIYLCICLFILTSSVSIAHLLKNFMETAGGSGSYKELPPMCKW